MACNNLSNYYPIVMKFSGYLLLYEYTSGIDFGPDRCSPSAGHAPKVGHNELDCSIKSKLSALVKKVIYGVHIWVIWYHIWDT